jgi:hypothetical protein
MHRLARSAPSSGKTTHTQHTHTRREDRRSKERGTTSKES